MKSLRRYRLKKQHGDHWTLAEIKQLGKVHDSALAHRTGRTIAEVVREREAHCIALPTARPWTAHEARLLGTMSDHELARRLRRFHSAVYSQRRKLEIAPFKPRGKVHHYAQPRPWLPKEDKLLGTMRDDHLAQRLGRNVKTVRYRRIKLGIPRAVASNWTAEQDAVLGIKSDREIANFLNRSPEAVAARRLILGISLSPKARLRRAPHRWTRRELRFLGRFSDADVAKRIGCSVLMVYKKRLKLRISLRRDLLQTKPWTAEEDKLVGTMPEKELARRLARSLVAITHRRIKLGRPVYRPALKRWTDAELALLGKLSDQEVAARTGHPVSSVAQKRADLCRPPVQPKRRPWQPQEIALLGTNTDKAVAVHLGRHYSTVAIKRLQLGIAPYRQFAHKTNTAP